MRSRDLVGQQVDQYHIQEFLARGGMADVYLALDQNLGRTVALKVLSGSMSEEPSALMRFQREARTIARLTHPNIIQVYSAGLTPLQRPYLAMQYISGGSLQDRLESLLEQERRLGVHEALLLARQIALALHHAHAAGVVHRDLKPSNILLQAEDVPVISDLGIAAVQQETTRLTQTGGIIGTPHYMSPEQVSGQQVDGRADLYALGIILYELLAGRPPFSGDTPLVILHQHVYQQPPPLIEQRPGLARATYQIVDMCLQKSPEARFQSALALVKAIDYALQEEGYRPSAEMAPISTASGPMPVYPAAPTPSTPRMGTSTPTVPVQRATPWVRWGIVAVVVLILAGLGGMLLLRGMGVMGGGGGEENDEATIPAVVVGDPIAMETVTNVEATSPQPDETAPAAGPTEPPAAPTATPEPTVTLPPSPVPTVVAVTSADVVAPRLDIEPNLDGSLDEWAWQAPVSSAYLVHQDDNWDGSEDMSAVWRLGWDGSYLYLAAAVEDDLHVQEQSGNQIFNGDSVDIQVDARQGSGPSARVGDNVFQITMSPGNFRNLPPSAFRWQGLSSGIFGNASAEGIIVAAQRTAGGYTLEAAVPWSYLATTPQAGLVLGIALNATDNDRPGVAVQEAFMSHVSGRLFNVPSSWGTLTLQ